MSVDDLLEELEIEFEAIARTLDELTALRRDVSARQPNHRELAAAGLFLANVYNGIENALKRLARYHAVPLPTGPYWHQELLQAFGEPPREGLPALLAADLAHDLTPYRRFRHIVHHGYGVELRWEDMEAGIARLPEVVARFKARIDAHLDSLMDAADT